MITERMACVIDEPEGYPSCVFDPNSEYPVIDCTHGFHLSQEGLGKADCVHWVKVKHRITENQIIQRDHEEASLIQEMRNLAMWMWKKHYVNEVMFEPLDSAEGVLSQIDNMVCGLKRKKEKKRTYPWYR